MVSKIFHNSVTEQRFSQPMKRQAYTCAYEQHLYICFYHYATLFLMQRYKQISKILKYVLKARNAIYKSDIV